MALPIQKRKIGKAGNGYAMYIPKALVEAEIVNLGEEYDILIFPKGKGKEAKDFLDKKNGATPIESIIASKLIGVEV